MSEQAPGMPGNPIKKLGPPGVIMPDSVLQNSKKEPLFLILRPYRGLKSFPTELRDVNTPEGFVFNALTQCFVRQNFVAEGLLSNIIWGFTQCGHDERKIAQGLTKLRQMGYIFYSTERRGDSVTDTNFDPLKPLWIRYADKMIDLFYRPETHNAQGLVLPSI